MNSKENNPFQEIWKLWSEDPVSQETWRMMLKESLMVHFYGSQTNQLMVQRDLHHEAYSFLCPILCPISFNSSQYF